VVGGNKHFKVDVNAEIRLPVEVSTRTCFYMLDDPHRALDAPSRGGSFNSLRADFGPQWGDKQAMRNDPRTSAFDSTPHFAGVSTPQKTPRIGIH